MSGAKVHSRSFSQRTRSNYCKFSWIFSCFNLLTVGHRFKGVDFMIKTLEVENSAGQREAVKLQIWDTAGQERFR